MNNVTFVTNVSRLQSRRPVAVAALMLLSLATTGCETQPKVPTAVVQSDQQELQKALTEAAQRAVEVRVGLARMTASAATNAAAQALQEPAIPAQARIDIDYVGPVESAVKLIGRTLGWDVSVNGKKRQETIVSLRHERQDSVTILRDIGTQCGLRCDVHVEVMEGGKSSIALSYRD